MSRIRRLLSLVILVTLGLGAPAFAQDAAPSLTIDPADTPLFIKGRLDATTASFSGFARLTYVGDAPGELVFLPSDLVSGDHVISRADVAMEGGASLVSKRPVDIRVTVNNVAYPGDYTGKFEFFIGDSAVLAAVPVELHIGVVPDVIAVTDALTLQVVRCASPFECGFASIFFPGTQPQRSYALQLENRTALQASIRGYSSAVIATNSLVGAEGITLRHPDTGAEVSAEQPALLGPNDIGQWNVIVDSTRLTPGQYTGSLRLYVSDLDRPLVVPVQLSVRTSPVVPLLLIFLGILMGRLVRRLDSPAVRAQQQIYEIIMRLRTDAEKITNAPARAYIDARIEAFDEANDAVKDDSKLAEMNATGSDIAARIRGFRTLDNLEATLRSEVFRTKAGTEAQLTKIKNARAALMTDGADALAQAETLLAELDAAWAKAANDVRSTRGEGQEEVERALKAQGAVALVDTTVKVPAQDTGVLARLRRLLIKLSGLSAETTFIVLRPLVWLTLVFILALMGLQNQYVNNGAAFGTNGIYDYLSLFLWGITADVASAGLLSLPQITRKEQPQNG